MDEVKSSRPSSHSLRFPGYGRQVEGLRKYLSTQSIFDKIQFIPVPDRGITGNFEVTAGDQLIHSKRQGQGKAESSQERAMIVERIVDILEEME